MAVVPSALKKLRNQIAHRVTTTHRSVTPGYVTLCCLSVVIRGSGSGSYECSELLPLYTSPDDLTNSCFLKLEIAYSERGEGTRDRGGPGAEE